MKQKLTKFGMSLFLVCTLVLNAGIVFGQSLVDLKGNISDTNGQPVIGAVVYIPGTDVGTSTDIDGNFKLQVKSDAVITIQSLGFRTIEEAVKGRTSIKVILEEDGIMLDETVTIGYAKGSKRTISGAVKNVGREEMNAGAIISPLESIKGKVAGVVISKNGGNPADGPSIRIRGTTSLSGGNDPLVIIDGVFGDLGMLNAISPSDIESFTILKDASETAQYGSRGASGVIYVTTTKGKYGQQTLRYDGSFGVDIAYKNIEMLSADEYREVVKTDTKYINAIDFGSDTNFLKEIQRVGMTNNHRVSFGSGFESGNYSASLGVVDQKGVIRNSDSRIYTAKYDAGQKFFDNKLNIEMGILASLRDKNYVNDIKKTFYSAAAFNPTMPNTINKDGMWPEDSNANEVDNPLGRLTIDDVEREAYTNVHARLSWNILKDLSLSAFGSYTYNNKINSTYIPINTKQGANREGGGKASKANSASNALLANVTLNYKKTLEKHYIDALLLAEVQTYQYSGFNASASSFGTDSFKYHNLKAGALVKYGNVGSYNNGYQLASLMGRINYVYDNKFIATLNFRGDGSSKLGINNKWGLFPSGSLAYNLSEENFIKNISWIDLLKVRAGFGITGNQDAISAYNSTELMVPQGTTIHDGKPVVTFGVARNANPDLRWEVKRMLNVGIDAELFNSRLNVTADYYHSHTDGMLYTYSVPVPPFIYPTLLANMGAMQNQGFELALSWTAIKSKDHTFIVSTNASWQANKLLSLDGEYDGQELQAPKYMPRGGISGAGMIGGNNNVQYWIVGQPVGVFYLPEVNPDYSGLVEGAGGVKYDVMDLNGDGINLADGEDRSIQGQAVPKIFLGANLNYRYKDFDVQMQLNGAFGHKIYNGTSLTYMNMGGFPTYNVMKEAPEKMIEDATVTNYWLEKGDYLNIDYLTFGYNFNINKKPAKATLSINNLYTFTGYSGLSPLINSTIVGDDLGIDDKRFYPISRSISLGLQLNF